MIRSSLWAAALAAALVLAGCTSTRPPEAAPADAAPASPATADSAEAASAPDAPQRRMFFERPAPPAFARAVAQGTRTLEGRPGPDYWQNEASYDLTTTVFPEEKRLEGQARITYQNNAPDTLGVLIVELAQNLHAPGAVRHEAVEVTGGVDLRHVAVGGQPLEADQQARPTYQVDGTRLIIAPAAPVLPGEAVELAIDYAFTIPQAGAGARMGYDGDDLLFLAYWYPIMAVYDDVVGWMADRFVGTAEFYADYGDYDVTVQAPAGWVVQSTGALQNPSEVYAPAVAGRRRRAHRSDEPVMILTPDQTGTRTDADSLTWRFQAEQVRDVAFAMTRNGYWEGARAPVGDVDGDGQADSTAINTFWHPEAPLWSEVTHYQQHAITALSEHLDHPYPYPHMTAVEGSAIIGGGMEFPMMTLMGDYNSRGDSALYYVTAHELAHMWIPMQVSTNERRYAWFDEGFTSYSENQIRKDFYPDATPSPDVREQANYLRAARAGLEGPVSRWSDYHYNPIAYGTASYSKPATLLVALRGLLGEETFQEATQTFIDDWAFKHPYPTDLFNAFERVSGRELDWFWTSFYDETWTVDQAIADVEPTEGGARITVADEGRAPLPVDLVLTLEDGETATHRIPVDVWLSGQTETTVTVETPAPVERVEIDPERLFPDVDRSDNTWTHGGA